MRKIRRTALLVAALLLCGSVPASAGISLSTVVLGDSFITGEGGTEKGPYLPGTDTPDNQCHRSLTSPPRLAARTHLVRLTADASCSGATTDNLLHTGQWNEPAQISRLDPTADRAYMMVAGNDIDFGLLLGCFLQTDCDQTTVPADSMGKLQELAPKLDTAFTAIREKAPRARVIVQLYPYLLPGLHGQTTGCPWLNETEHGLGVSIQATLNKIIRVQAREHGFRVAVPVNFEGHDLCSDQSWFYQPGTVPQAATAHPNPEGRKALARNFLMLTR